jgi:hypothetical protein
MNRLARLFTWVLLAGLFGSVAVSVSRAATPLLPTCSWPFEVTGQGLSNVATPDTNATYWVMPLDTSRWRAVVINGTYPNARFFNFNTYGATGALIDSIVDANLQPIDANPFATPTAVGSGNYTLSIGSNASGSENVLSTDSAPFVFIVYRVYLADQGKDRTGGVGLPAISLTDLSGNTRNLQPCPFANAETSLPSLIFLLRAAGFSNAANFLEQILTLANRSAIAACSIGQPSTAPVIFSTNVPGANFFPNPQTTYFQTANVCYQANEVLVVRGKAPVYPDTYLGGSVFQPAPGLMGSIQLRYWSMCNNDGVIPYPVVACQADVATNLDTNQFYTYVISADPAPPSWLPAGATWLPWGPTALPITLIFRAIMQEPGFSVTGEYLPVGALCNETQVQNGGWQGCFAAAGLPVNPP